ncbi:hypothetical protein BFN67_22045 [Pseudaminobacter manganicus]|uniref:Lipopolysaccharide export system permease protein LptF n=1 Tax=Manganibacter manganicus TaxID=1873176 RepID=A0A1V8RMN7_9HYPH|nr:hypothetical protein BFN67_22045 [Pseudaminobacter manganicus]
MIDRYLLSLVARPLVLSLVVVLVALLLERVLRLVNILAAFGSSQYWLLGALTATLVPHYLGLALAAAFFVALFVAMIRLGDGSELDVLLASGLSIWRLTVPFVLLGCALAIFSLALYGFLNPVSRYDYRRLLHSAIEAAWDAHVPPNTFVKAGHGLTIAADTVDSTGRKLLGVFIHRKLDGLDEVTSAESGTLVLSPDRAHLQLILHDGAFVREHAGLVPDTVRFKNLTFGTKFELDSPPFRDRGNSERELTFPELWRGIAKGDTELPAPVLKAELADRIVRSLALPLLPLLAIPLSFASRRGSRTTGLIVAAVLLVTFNNALQLGRDLGAAGLGWPVLTVATPFLVFAALSIWLYLSTMQRPVEAPVVRVIARVEAMASALATRLRPKRRA